MNENLAVRDPLADKTVTILINLTPDSPHRAERTTTITVGVQGEPPVFKRGAFEDVVELIDQVWLAFGVRQQVAATANNTMESETIAEAVVADDSAVASEAGIGSALPAPQISQPPRQSPQNLSLF